MGEQEITGDKLKIIAWFLTETVKRKPMQQKVRTSVGEEGGGRWKKHFDLFGRTTCILIRIIVDVTIFTFATVFPLYHSYIWKKTDDLKKVLWENYFDKWTYTWSKCNTIEKIKLTGSGMQHVYVLKVGLVLLFYRATMVLQCHTCNAIQCVKFTYHNIFFKIQWERKTIN